MANKPYYENLDWKLRQPLKYRTGGEIVENIVLASGSITADSAGRKLLAKGEVVVKITSGDDSGKWGPYLKTASDGTQTVDSTVINSVGIMAEGHDLALGDEAGACFLAFAAFDKSELTLNGISWHGTPLSNLKAAFPTCIWLD